MKIRVLLALALSVAACGDAASPEDGTSTASSNVSAPPSADADYGWSKKLPSAGPCGRSAAHGAPIALFDAFAAEIWTLPDQAKKDRVDRLLADVAAQGGTPLEDAAGDRVMFLARGGGPWRAAGSFGGWSGSSTIALGVVPGTDLWAGEAVLSRSESFEYKLVSGDSWREDPLARNVVWDGIDRGFGVRGELNGLGHPGSLPMSRGRMVSAGKVHASRLGNDRDVWVHYPAAYDDGSCRKLPSIVIHDGLESLTRGGFAREADRLYAARPDLAAVIVFVGLPSQDVRMAEYTFGSPGARGPDYVDFLASDLWPKLSGESRLCASPAARGISGASLGGLISTWAGFERPDQWGWIGAQSASYFWADGAMLARAWNDPHKPLRIYLDSGCPNDNCDVTDRMADILGQRGYDFVRIRKDGAQHDWGYWRDRLPGMLTHFRDGQTACDP